MKRWRQGSADFGCKRRRGEMDEFWDGREKDVIISALALCSTLYYRWNQYHLHSKRSRTVSAYLSRSD